jgi:addiction module HigA family antidote
MKTKKLAPVHPGEILLHDFMEPLGLSQYALAKAIGVTPRRVSQIVRGQRAVTADTALPSHVISARARAGGWTCRRTTTWKGRLTNWKPGLPAP